MTNYKWIQFNRDEGRADLIFNRPPENYLNAEVLEEVVRALDPHRDDESLKVLVIRGAGNHFISGFEVEELQADLVGLLMPAYTRFIDFLNEIRGLTLVAVKGNALGCGCEIASFCDVIISAESARFGFPEISMGLFPSIGAAVLPRLIGRNQTLDWIISGDIVTAREAQEAHLVARVVSDENLDKEIERYAQRVASLSAPSIVLAKKAVDGGLYSSVMEALRITESTYMLDLMNSIDPHEGIKAKLEGREPVWKNR